MAPEDRAAFVVAIERFVRWKVEAERAASARTPYIGETVAARDLYMTSGGNVDLADVFDVIHAHPRAALALLEIGADSKGVVK